MSAAPTPRPKTFLDKALSPENIGLQLMDGALGYVGGQIIAHALGDPTLEDVKSWIEEAVQELEEFFTKEIREQLEQFAVDDITAKLQGLMNQFRTYALLESDGQVTREDRHYLEHCDDVSSYLVTYALLYPPALHLSTAVMAYRLMTMYATYHFDILNGDEPKSDYIETLRTEMDQYVKQASETLDAVDKQMLPSAHVSKPSIVYLAWDKTSPINPMVGWHALIIKDGKYVFMPWSKTEKEETEIATEKYNELVASIAKAEFEFRYTVITAINDACECYDKMCKEIGSQYEPQIQLKDPADDPAYDSFPIGTVLGYAGPFDAIPQGWHLCDGTDGTKNLNAGIQDDPHSGHKTPIFQYIQKIK